MALIAIAVYCTEENNKDEYLVETLRSLALTIDSNKHRVVLSVNGTTKKTEAYLDSLKYPIYDRLKLSVIRNVGNEGTAAAINRAWQLFRYPGENLVKMDDDIVIKKESHCDYGETLNNSWIDQMEEVIRRDPSIGQVGLKRKDCWETPWNDDPHYRSELRMLPHDPGEKWIIVEEVNHVMGSCVMHSAALIDKIGYLYQPKLYGFDDALMSFRSKKAGFKNVFLPHIEIDHIDTGATPYQGWKEQHASECWSEYHRLIRGYEDSSIPLYYNPYDSNSNTNLQ